MAGEIKGYYAVRERSHRKPGDPTHDIKGCDLEQGLIVHTWHRGLSSMDMECRVWEGRGHVRDDSLYDVILKKQGVLYT